VDEIGVFAMEGHGLPEVGNPRCCSFGPRQGDCGQRGVPAMEGTRPVLVEIQALIVRLQSGATPPRGGGLGQWAPGHAAGGAGGARCGLNFSSEVYLNVGGIVADPAADLAVAAAGFGLADKPLPAARCGLARSRWRGRFARWPMLAAFARIGQAGLFRCLRAGRKTHGEAVAGNAASSYRAAAKSR
jgi:predicted ATP-dependent serine protease